jgi:hypothetical protein
MNQAIGLIEATAKVRHLLYKISEIQVFAGTALYLLLSENILLSACTFLPNCCFFVLFVP